MTESGEGELRAEARGMSIKEGCFSAFSSGVGDNFIIPFAQELLAKPFHIGILNAFPGLLSPIAQAFGSRLIENSTRKKIVLRFVLLQSLMWIPLAIIAFMFYSNIWKDNLPFLLVAGYSLIAILGGLTGPAWFSWMGDIVDEKTRGKYFSKRNRITGAFGMLGFLVGAFFLDYLKTKGLIMLGFMVLFVSAFSFRFVAYNLFKSQYEPKFSVDKDKYYFSFWQFIGKKTNFLNFSIYLAVFHFAMTLAGPFFVVYMLRELNFSYVTYMIVSLSATAFYLLFVPLAGKISDKYGNKTLLVISAVLFSIYPLFWMILESPLALILLPQLMGGIATAAFAIGMTNFIYDTVTPARRAICVAYTNILVGIGVFLGSLAGGFILNSLHPSWMNAFFFVFLISALFRALSSLVFLPKIKEIRVVEKIKYPLTFAMHPFKLVQAQFVWMKDNSLRFIPSMGKEGKEKL